MAEVLSSSYSYASVMSSLVPRLLPIFSATNCIENWEEPGDEASYEHNHGFSVATLIPDMPSDPHLERHTRILAYQPAIL